MSHRAFRRIEAEINSNGSPGKVPAPASRNGNGNGHGASKANGGQKATNAQIKYMTSLAGEQGAQLSALNAFVKDQFGVDSLYNLSKHDASKLVDGLKRGVVKIPA